MENYLVGWGVSALLLATMITWAIRAWSGKVDLRLDALDESVRGAHRLIGGLRADAVALSARIQAPGSVLSATEWENILGLVNGIGNQTSHVDTDVKVLRSDVEALRRDLDALRSSGVSTVAEV